MLRRQPGGRIQRSDRDRRVGRGLAAGRARIGNGSPRGCGPRRSASNAQASANRTEKLRKAAQLLTRGRQASRQRPDRPTTSGGRASGIDPGTLVMKSAAFEPGTASQPMWDTLGGVPDWDQFEMVPDSDVGGVVRVSADRVGEGVFDAGGSRLPGPGRFVDEVERAAPRSESEVWELVVVVEGYGERVESFVGGLLARGVLVATQDDGGRWVVRGRDLTTADGVEQYPDGELRRAVDAARRGRNESLDRLTGAVNRKLAAVEASRPVRLREVFGHEVYASWRELSTTGLPRLHNISRSRRRHRDAHCQPRRTRGAAGRGRGSVLCGRPDRGGHAGRPAVLDPAGRGVA